MYPCCAYDPGLQLFALGEDGETPLPETTRLDLVTAIAAALVLVALFALVS